MILVWSSEGGPLQYIGALIFAFQFFGPQLFRLYVSISEDVTFEIDPFPFMRIGLGVAITTIVGVLWVALDFVQQGFEEEDGGGVGEDQEQQQQQQYNDNVGTDTNTTSGAPTTNNNSTTNGDEGTSDAPSSGTATTNNNPEVVDLTGDDDDIDNVFFLFPTRIGRRITTMLQSISPTHLMLAIGFVLPLAMLAPVLFNGIQHDGLAGIFASDRGVIQVTALAIIAHSMMAIAAYRVLRDVLDGNGVGPYPGNVRGRRRRNRKLTVGEISDIVRKVPVEEFVSEEDIHNGECSVGRMKRMLKNRGVAEAADKCVEREDLVKEVERVRKYNEECAICAEEYVEG